MATPVVYVIPSEPEADRLRRGFGHKLMSEGKPIASNNEPDCAGDVTVSYKIIKPDGSLSPGGWVKVFNAHQYQYPAVGDARLRAVPGGLLVDELRWPPPGTSAASDEARRVVEAGLARLSIGFRGRGKPNRHGGLDFDPAEVFEVSLVGLGCVAEAGFPGKCAKHGGPPRYLVDPQAVARGTAAAVATAAREAITRTLLAPWVALAAALDGKAPAPVVKCCRTPSAPPITRAQVEAAVDLSVRAAVKGRLAYMAGSIDGEPVVLARPRKFC